MPIEVISARKLMGSTPARIATTIDTMMVFATGVMVRGLTFWNTLGAMPSRDMANRMRVCP